MSPLFWHCTTHPTLFQIHTHHQGNAVPWWEWCPQQTMQLFKQQQKNNLQEWCGGNNREVKVRARSTEKHFISLHPLSCQHSKTHNPRHNSSDCFIWKGNLWCHHGYLEFLSRLKRFFAVTSKDAIKLYMYIKRRMSLCCTKGKYIPITSV